MTAPTVWVVYEYVPFEGDRVADIFATKERAERFISTKNHKRPGSASLYRVKAKKVRG